MGQKTNPNGYRLGINKDWKSRYFPTNNTEFAKWNVEDKKIRKYLDQFYKEWGISSVEMERIQTELKVIINTARPGVIIGEDGKNVAAVKLEIAKILKNRNIEISVDVKELEHPDIDATVIANEIAVALENRASFRITQKRAIGKVMRAGAKGIKTQVSGRLNGVDMARSEGYSEGEVPLQTLRNDIDFATTRALTTYGILGVKVWISKGEIIGGKHVSPIRPRGRRFDNKDKKPRNFKPRDNKPTAYASREKEIAKPESKGVDK